MKIYYIKVNMKKDVAVSWEAEGTSGSPGKLPSMEEAVLPEVLRVGAPPSSLSSRNLPSDCEPSGEKNKHKTKAEPHHQPGSPAVKETLGTGMSRVKTPDWLWSVESGFKCMACCRVFATIDVLQEHVQYGIREGFSCHVFHRTMTQLRGGVEARSTQEKAQVEEQEAEQEQQEDGEECEEQQPSGEGLAPEKFWSPSAG
nr:protein FAM170A [Cavia porcellus]